MMNKSVKNVISAKRNDHDVGTILIVNNNQLWTIGENQENIFLTCSEKNEIIKYLLLDR